MLSTQGGIRADDGTPIALGLSHGPLGSRPARAEAAARAQAGRRRAVRRLLLRSVRRPHAGHGRHVRQPAVSQRRRDRLSPADSLAAHAARRARRGDVRQGTAGDDDGAGRHARLAVRARARRRDAAADARAKTPARCNRSAPAMRTARSRWKKRPTLGCRACASPGGGCQFLGTAATSQVVGEALGMSLPHSALAPSGQPIWLDMARRSARRLIALAERKHHAARHSHRRRDSQRDDRARGLSAARRTCCCTFRRSRSPPACGGRPSTTGTRSIAACRGSSMCCRTGRSVIRPCACSWPAACPKSCCTCASWDLLDLDVLTVSRRHAGRDARLVGEHRRGASAARDAARARRRRCRTT